MIGLPSYVIDVPQSHESSQTYFGGSSLDSKGIRMVPPTSPEMTLSEFANTTIVPIEKRGEHVEQSSAQETVIDVPRSVPYSDIYASPFNVAEILKIKSFFSSQHPCCRFSFKQNLLSLKGKGDIKIKNVLLVKEPFAYGGESLIYFAALRGKTGIIKFFTIPVSRSTNKPAFNKLEWQLSSRPKNLRITQKGLLGNQCILLRAYAANGDLMDFLLKHPDVNKKPILVQMLRNYLTMAAENYVHRDIKLRNFLVNADQSITLSDFGLSEKYDKIAKKFDCVGTPSSFPFDYQKGKVDLREADIYALGVALLRLYNLEMFPRNSPTNSCHEILHRFGEFHLAKVPQEAQAMVRRMIFNTGNTPLKYLNEELKRLEAI
ncbi:MAG: protein kinase domain-containing protein [Chlamydiia bacterium]